VDTFILVLAGVFAVGMFLLLPKYARFINNQPKLHMERMRQQAEEEKAGESSQENPPNPL